MLRCLFEKPIFCQIVFITLISGVLNISQLLAQDTLEIKSAEDGRAIHYAMVTPDNPDSWFTSNSEGLVILERESRSSEEKLVISAFGFRDVVVNRASIKGKKTVLLEEQSIDLDPVTIQADRMKTRVIGDMGLPLALAGSIGNKTRKSTGRYAVYLDFKKSEDKVLTRLNVYVSEAGDKDLSLILRVMVSDKVPKPKEGRLYEVNHFLDLKYENIRPIKLRSYGWNEIDLTDFNIVVPAHYQGAFLVFDVLNNHRQETPKSLVIPFQDKSNEKRLYAAFSFKSQIGILDKNRDHFAVKVEYVY